ncbi:MAG: hypothetical protein LBO75_05155 [Bifidobacteriaceae bacterium]|nr:hypothetical protein [Bifidobacteriaceae bacterium]
MGVVGAVGQTGGGTANGNSCVEDVGGGVGELGVGVVAGVGVIAAGAEAQIAGDCIVAVAEADAAAVAGATK